MLSGSTERSSDVTQTARIADARIGVAIIMGLIALLECAPGVVARQPHSTPVVIDLRLNPNEASASELALLPDVGPKRAAAIIDARPYASLDEVDRAKSIGPVILERIRPYLSLDSDRAGNQTVSSPD